MVEPENRILCGDALEMLKTLPPESAHMCVCSPPYYAMRDYEAPGQIGLEDTPGEYIEKLVLIFREVRRVLRTDGTLWLNIGDCYAGSGKGAWNKTGERPKSKHTYLYTTDDPATGVPKTWPGVKPKDMLGIPWMLAFALRDDGWYLRSDIIWHKINAMPESVKDRPSKSHEHLFLLAKSQKYYFNHEAIKEPCSGSNISDFIRRKTLDNKGKGDGTYEEVRPDLCRSREAYMPADFRRNCRDVWSIATSPYHGAHFASYPIRLVTPCILAGSPVGGVVLDPFFGSGATGVAALRLGRYYIGIDLNPAYCELAENRIRYGDEPPEDEYSADSGEYIPVQLRLFDDYPNMD